MPITTRTFYVLWPFSQNTFADACILNEMKLFRCVILENTNRNTELRISWCKTLFHSKHSPTYVEFPFQAQHSLLTVFWYLFIANRCLLCQVNDDLNANKSLVNYLIKSYSKTACAPHSPAQPTRMPRPFVLCKLIFCFKCKGNIQRQNFAPVLG